MGLNGGAVGVQESDSNANGAPKEIRVELVFQNLGHGLVLMGQAQNSEESKWGLVDPSVLDPTDLSAPNIEKKPSPELPTHTGSTVQDKGKERRVESRLSDSRVEGI